LTGKRLSTKFFEEEIHLRENILVNEKKLRVVGIMERATHTFGEMFNNAIVTTLSDLEELSDETLTPFRIFVELEEGQGSDEVKERVEEALEREHGRKDFQVITPQQISETAGSVLGIIQLVLVGIAAISLLVGGIGIMNTMLMAVTERTGEIGVMKAIGATNTRILGIFLVEAALIGLAGGIIGVLVGTGLASLVSIAAEASALQLQAVVSPVLVAAALAFSMLVGLLSGLIPARRASQLDPVEAMRHS
jgi:putative ABC transport system permease protein